MKSTVMAVCLVLGLSCLVIARQDRSPEQLPDAVLNALDVARARAWLKYFYGTWTEHRVVTDRDGSVLSDEVIRHIPQFSTDRAMVISSSSESGESWLTIHTIDDGGDIHLRQVTMDGLRDRIWFGFIGADRLSGVYEAANGTGNKCTINLIDNDSYSLHWVPLGQDAYSAVSSTFTRVKD